MIQGLGLRWLITLLFLFSAAVCARGMVAGRHSASTLIGHSLHAIMAIAMAVMAWPRGADLPTRAPMLFFAAAAVWFATIMITGRQHRAANGYHTLMMAAMAWMYAAMGGLPSPNATSEPTGHDRHAGHAGHPRHSAAGHVGTDTASWIGVLNWVCAIGFGVAAAVWLHRFVDSRRQSESGAPGRSLGILCQFAMATGMAIMFAAML